MTGQRRFADLDISLRDALESVDSRSRKDLRTRLAATLRSWIASQQVGELLPSVRSVAETVGVHRATVHAAFAALESEGLVARKENGRFVCASATPQSVDALLAEAADAALRSGMSEEDFTALARRSFENRSIHEVRVVFVRHESDFAIDAELLSHLLAHPVQAVTLDAVEPTPNTVFVATVAHVSAVRARVSGVNDTFSVGLALDTDLRLAVCELPTAARVGIATHDDSEYRYVCRRLAEIRPDLQVELTGRDSLSKECELRLDVLLHSADVPAPSTDDRVALRQYRTGITSNELAFLKARLMTPDSAKATADGFNRQRTESAID